MNKPSDHGNDRVCKGVCVCEGGGVRGGGGRFRNFVVCPEFLSFFSSSPLFLRCLLFFLLVPPPVCV